MKAAYIKEYGSSEIIKIGETSMPVISDGKVIIKVIAASLNPIDSKIRNGLLKGVTSIDFPKILGLDLSGTVDKVLDNNSKFKKGDEIYGQADFFNGGGSIAEYTTANINSISTKPQNINFIEAAALPLVAVSAYQAIVENMHLKKDQKILIHGGAGGIGSIAIQIAKSLGAFVSTTVSSKDVDFVKSLKVDEIIEYTKSNFVETIKDYDSVLDLIGGDVYLKSFSVLKSGGVIVSLVEQPNSEMSAEHNVNARYQMTKVNNLALEKITELVESNKLKILLDSVFNIDKTIDAFQQLEVKHPKGKVVIEI